MRIVMSGATGFIGRALVAECLRDGNEVVALTRDARIARARLPDAPRLSIAEWDARHLDPACVEGATAIVNLAGESINGGRWDPAKKRALIESRVACALAFRDALQHAINPPRRFIQASAVGYYGAAGSEDGAFTEASPVGTGFLAGTANATEQSVEGIQGTSLAIIRSGIVLGRGGGTFASLALPFRFGVGAYPGHGNQWVSWIDIADEVRAIRFLLENEDITGAVNLTAPNPVTMKQLCVEVGRALRRSMIVSIPPFVLRLFYGEMADEALLGGQRVLPERLTAAGFKFSFPTASESLAKILAR